MDDKAIIARLNKVYSLVLKSRRSNFYRKKYLPAGRRGANLNLPKIIKSFEDWKKIPFLEKKELLNTPPFDRLFLPFEKIITLEPSSGTTEKPLVMFTGALSQKQRLIYEKHFRELKIKRFLSLHSPLQAYHRTQAYKIKGVMMIVGDVRNLALTAQVSSQVKIQAIRSTATILEEFLPYLGNVYDLGEICYVILGGEFCTLQRAKALQEKLPRAKIHFSCGSAETSIRGYQCDFLAKISPQYFHPFPDLYFEIIDGQNGQLVLTTLSQTYPTPLVRYRTGDCGILKKYHCPCKADYLFEMRGRADFDFLKVCGVMIHAQRVQDAVSKFPHLVKDDFQLHVYETKRDSKILLLLELELVLEKDEKADVVDFLAEEISKNLYLTPNLTLADFIRRGLFLPLKIKPVASFEVKPGEKKKYILSHLTS